MTTTYLSFSTDTPIDPEILKGLSLFRDLSIEFDCAHRNGRMTFVFPTPKVESLFHPVRRVVNDFSKLLTIHGIRHEISS